MPPQDNLAAYRGSPIAPAPAHHQRHLAVTGSSTEVLDNGAASIIMPDLCWCGGLSEAKKISAMAVSYLPVAPHNCGGQHRTSHLGAPGGNLTNLTILETVHRHYLDEYRGILTDSLVPVNGKLPLPTGVGLGVDLDPALFERTNVKVQWLRS
jgi:L-alanine-DL-glutamate epimerase-like enolase superfamily enzyme